MRSTGKLAGACVAALLALGAGALAQQSPALEADPWSVARELYRTGDFAGALPYIVEAIQREPERADLYLGHARTLFQAGRLDEAVWYYELYVSHFGPTLPEDTSPRNRVERAREERDSANAGRADPTAPLPPMEAQETARQALVERIFTGPILTTSQGGAVAVYQALLRSGYARPDLVELRASLVAGLLDEAERTVDPRAAAMPVLSIQEWTAQRRRFQLVRELSPRQPDPSPSPEGAQPAETTALEPSPPDAGSGEEGSGEGSGDNASAPFFARPVENLTAQIALCEAQLQFLNLNFDVALREFEGAIAADADLIPAHMGRINALLRLRRGSFPETRAALGELEQALDRLGVGAPDLLVLYAAVLASQGDDDIGAATALGEIVGIPPE